MECTTYIYRFRFSNRHSVWWLSENVSHRIPDIKDNQKYGLSSPVVVQMKVPGFNRVGVISVGVLPLNYYILVVIS